MEHDIPAHYLSRDDRGLWAIILEGIPLCTDGTLERAILCAKGYRLATDGPWWDGSACEFRPAAELPLGAVN